MRIRLLPLLAASIAMSAETPTPATKANYPLAARWTAQKVGKMVFDTTVTPHWLDTGDRFWYTWESTKGRRFYLVDPARKTKTPVFDPAALAAALSTATGVPFDAQHLPMKTLKFVRNESAIQFEAAVPKDALIAGVKAEEQSTDAASDTPPPAGAAPTKNITVEYDLATGKLTVLPEAPPHKMRWASISPDGNTVVFARGQNLFLMDAGNYAKAQKKPDDASIVETQVTTDGEEHFGYARRLTDQEKGPLRRDQGKDKNPRVPSIAISWAKDSRKFAVIRRDQRKVGDLWVINSLANPRPTLETYRYDMPGEANATQSQLEIFDRSSNARVIAKAARFTDQALAIENTPATGRDKEHEKTEAQWVSADSSRIYFNRLSRDLHRLDICVADTATGEVKAIVEERMNVYIESKPIRMIDQDRAFLFWSERDGWGHYYLYDANGTLKNRVTQGEFVSEELLGVDEKTRTAYVVAEGKEEGENPYYPHLYRVGLDGSNMKLLDPGDATHAISMSDSTRYFVDNSSRVDSVPKSVLLDAQGAQMLDLETPDLTLLNAAGYRFPEPFHVKADDGVTDLYGVMYKPFDFDENKKYPIVAFVYPGPQTEQVTQVFSPKSPNVALAQLGFIVIEVGNRGGNPHRSKWYHTFGYGNLRDYGLADKKWAIEQLAALHPFIDADRVGIYGHSGGGFMSTAAMLIYPDFFKVAVSSSGNHENNIYNKWWSEKHHGVKETEDKDGKVQIEYSIDKNSEIARNLKGHLLLATGDMDDNVHPANTLRMVDALIKANKRFDMIVLPGKRHPYADESEYFFWVRADYFARHLLGSFDQSVDMWEINNEKQMKPNVPPATRRRATGTTSGPTIE